MRLYGTTTSPYVRIVHVLATELGLAPERVDTATDAGQAALRAVSPIWKVPAAELDGRVLLDSRSIFDWLTATRGWGGLAPPRDPVATRTQVVAIEAALDAAIQPFYLRRDGLDLAGVPWADKNRARIAAIFGWLDGERAAGRFGAALGHAELALICTLDWMDFRAAYPTADHPTLLGVRRAFADRPSVAATRPHG